MRKVDVKTEPQTQALTNRVEFGGKFGWKMLALKIGKIFGDQEAPVWKMSRALIQLFHRRSCGFRSDEAIRS